MLCFLMAVTAQTKSELLQLASTHRPQSLGSKLGPLSHTPAARTSCNHAKGVFECKAWQGILRHHQVPPGQVSIVDHAKDLGALFRCTRRIVALMQECNLLLTWLTGCIVRRQTLLSVRDSSPVEIWSKVLEFGHQYAACTPTLVLKAARSRDGLLNGSMFLMVIVLSAWHHLAPCIFVKLDLRWAPQDWSVVPPASIFASNVWISLSLYVPFTMLGPVA